MKVTGTFLSPGHTFSKQAAAELRLIEGLGVEGDAHCGATVKHRSRVARDPTQPNLRQVHLIHEELFAELAAHGHAVRPGELGENITTRGLDLLGLPQGSLLRIGPSAVLRVTGLRNPCGQIEAFQRGLLGRVAARDAQGRTVRKAGVMAVVLQGGMVRGGDAITVERPEIHLPLERV